MDEFDAMAARFTAHLQFAANWKHNYLGAAYATRVKSAIATARAACDEAEKHVEMQPAPVPFGGRPTDVCRGGVALTRDPCSKCGATVNDPCGAPP